MQALDVMTTNIITVEPDTPVKEIARLLLRHRISAVPVVGADRQVLGVVSEGDLMRRPENETESRHSWWLEMFASTQEKAVNYIESHGQHARDIMTTDVISVPATMPLYEIAALLEKHRIKRVPVTTDGRIVGIVSRSNLLHGLAIERPESERQHSPEDRSIRTKLLEVLSKEVGIDTWLINVVVDDGVVQLWGIVSSSPEKKAAQLAAENTDGVTAVENNLSIMQAWKWAG